MYKTPPVQLYTCIYHRHNIFHHIIISSLRSKEHRERSPYLSEKASLNYCIIFTRHYQLYIILLSPFATHFPFIPFFVSWLLSLVISFNISNLTYSIQLLSLFLYLFFFLVQYTSLWRYGERFVDCWAWHYQKGARCGMPFLLLLELCRMPLEFRWLNMGGVPGEMQRIPCSSSPEVEPEDLS